MKLIAALLLAFCALPCFAAAPASRPNIVLIVADHMGASDIGPYGATDIRTPSLDKLAAQGVRFTNFYAAAPVCGPSRAAMLTGKYPARIDFEDNIGHDDGLSAEVAMIPALLKQRGYKSAVFGKWHLGRSEATDPRAHGFDEFFGYHDWSIHHYTHRNDAGEEALTHDRSIVKRDGYLTEVLTDESIRFVEENHHDPFFLFLSYNAALPPYLGPDLPPDRWDAEFEIGTASRADYIAMVESMDAGIGRLLQAIERLGLAEDTLVLFTYDHNGRNLVRNAPYSGGFAMLNEGGIRVPLIVRWPGTLAAGQTLHRPGIGMDIAATVLAAAGVDTEPLNLDGRDLVGAPAPDDPRTFFWRIKLGDFGQAAARRDNWKLLVHRFSIFRKPTVYLFDLEKDPSESRDLYHQQQALADELHRDLIHWEATVVGPDPSGVH
jgi:arylsulfatase A-like enzyme